MSQKIQPIPFPLKTVQKLIPKAILHDLNYFDFNTFQEQQQYLDHLQYKRLQQRTSCLDDVDCELSWQWFWLQKLLEDVRGLRYK